ncbi:MAG: rhomboid family intramembrane serine protease, partial [Parachlamydiaceae bacterium]
MRLIYTTSDVPKGHKLSIFLTGKKIQNQLETTVDTDWGNHTYGNSTAKIWVYDEDQFEEAMPFVNAFESNPDDPQFEHEAVKVLPRPHVMISKPDEGSTKINPGFAAFSRAKKGLQVDPMAWEPFDKITVGFIVLCCLIFFMEMLTMPSVTMIPNYLPSTPLTSSPVEKKLFYDYPRAFEIVDKLVNLYGINALGTPQDLPTEGKYILAEFHKIPYWEGGYDLLVQEMQGKPNPQQLPPFMEKIGQGEVWRVFTPCLLHGGVLHILFNMLWLVVLGKQMGQRLRPG